MKRYEIALIPGDGIGPEVAREGVKALEAVARVHGGLSFRFTEFPWNCAYYLEHGVMMPADALDVLKNYHCIFLGAIGHPAVPDHVSVWDLILKIRRGFQQYVNLRPVKLLRGLSSPLREKGPEDIDFIVLRENTEGEYSNMGGRLHQGTPYEMAVQNSVFTRFGVERVVRYAYRLAASRPKKKLTGATKSNGINFAMPFWDEVFKEIGQEFPEVAANLSHIDALASFFVSRPETFDVVVASNLFGDILTDLGGAIAGGLGMAPSGNINPEGTYPSMFEPVHGSAPDIAGKGIANPVGQIWSASLMLDHLGEPELAKLVLDSIENVLVAGEVRTPDLGGKATTAEMGDAICRAVLSESELR
ncbi:tartrate dehydrogenase [Clostridiales bacterium PH28_bin88]|nr:tartrate dehydrogenase [Clostridiales bacterium PH28_bin88]